MRHRWLKGLSVLLADKITVIGNEMSVQTSRFANAGLHFDSPKTDLQELFITQIFFF